MDLKDFVSNTIKEIEEGIDSATDESESNKYKLSAPVMFNLAITSNSTDTSAGGKGVKVKLYVVEANLGKDDGSVSSSEYVQRVQFEVGAVGKRNGRPL